MTQRRRLGIQFALSIINTVLIVLLFDISWSRASWTDVEVVVVLVANIIGYWEGRLGI